MSRLSTSIFFLHKVKMFSFLFTYLLIYHAIQRGIMKFNRPEKSRTSITRDFGAI